MNNLTYPIDLKSEQHLLSRILYSVDSANLAIESLTSEDFSNPVHKVIFSAMSSLYSKDCEIEPVMVANEMSFLFPKENHATYLFGLEALKFGDSSEVKYFIENIKETSRLRRLINLGIVVSKEAAEKNKSEDILNKFNKEAEALFIQNSKAIRSISELINSEYAESGKDFLGYLDDQMQKNSDGCNVLRGLPTGYSLLDNYLSGLCGGHYIILGARPGVGKTTFSLNIMRNLILKSISVGFFSLEMTAQEAMVKLICLDAHINAENCQRGKINSFEYQELLSSSKRLEKLPLFIDDQESLTIQQLIARAKRMVISHKIEVLFIDYLGEVRGGGKFSSKQEEIQHVSKSIRGLAKNLKIPIVVICQLNRETEKEKRSPKKSDLRESGQIEADAHSILLLHKSTDEENMEMCRIKLYIVKNRFGKEGIIHYGFKGEIGQFEEIDYRHQDE
jgi:replicative DNA helicase